MVKVTLRHALARTESRRRYSSNPFETRNWKEVGGQHNAPAALIAVKTRYPLYRIGLGAGMDGTENLEPTGFADVSWDDNTLGKARMNFLLKMKLCEVERRLTFLVDVEYSTVLIQRVVFVVIAMYFSPSSKYAYLSRHLQQAAIFLCPSSSKTRIEVASPKNFECNCHPNANVLVAVKSNS